MCCSPAVEDFGLVPPQCQNAILNVLPPSGKADDSVAPLLQAQPAAVSQILSILVRVMSVAVSHISPVAHHTSTTACIASATAKGLFFCHSTCHLF